jgi:hypothetical protein
VTSDFVFLFGHEVDLGGQNLVRFVPVLLPFDGSADPDADTCSISHWIWVLSWIVLEARFG